MKTLYILAHFDDEYFAWPLILRGQKAGDRQYFAYVADYAPPVVAKRRQQESVCVLGRMGVPASHLRHAGSGVGLMDGALHRDASGALEALRRVANEFGSIDQVVVTAWEGGHPDHDACALLALALARELGEVPVLQFALYNGKGLSGPLFRAGRVLSENGAVEPVRMGWSEWLRYCAAVRHYPSQWRTWLGLWPAMFLTYSRWGFAYQRLTLARAEQRPHMGELLYERKFGVGYGELEVMAAALHPVQTFRSETSI